MSGHGIHHPRESRDMPKQPSQNAACLLETKIPNDQARGPWKASPSFPVQAARTSTARVQLGGLFSP